MATEHGSGFAATNGTDLVMQYIHNNGDTDMGVDGSETPVIFKYAPPAGKRFIACELSISLSSTVEFEKAKFAHLTALTNGVSIRANGTEIINWKSNRDIATLIPGWKPSLGETSEKPYSLNGNLCLGVGQDCLGIEIQPGNGFRS